LLYFFLFSIINKNMNTINIRRLTLHGMMLQGGFWFGYCAFYAYMVTTLIDYGWSDSAAAGLITAMSVIVMLTQPLYGYLSDNFLSEKKLTVILLFLAGVCFFLMPFSLNSGSKLLVIINLTGTTLTGMHVGGLLDSWIVGLKQEFRSVNYGLIRGIGSFAYASSAQITGLLTIAFGHSTRLWLGCGVFLITVFIALTFRSTRNIRDTGANTDLSSRLGGIEAFKLIFSSKQYCLLLGVSFLLLLSNLAMTTLIQLIIRNFGGTAAQIGTATAFMAASEVPCMFFAAFFLKKLGFKKLIVFCSVLYTVRMFLTASVGTVDNMIYVQLLQGLTYAILTPISMSYLSQILDERVRTTAVTTYAAVTMSLTGILGNLITSALLAAGFTAQSALIVFTVSSLLGFLLALYGSIRRIWDIKTVG